MMSATPPSSPVEQAFARAKADLALVAGTIERLELLFEAARQPAEAAPRETQHVDA